MRLNTATVKQLCSTDEIQAEKKYKAPFHFVPSHTLVLYTNHLPKVGANDDGIWRRLIVIPFNAKITGDNDIKNYADYLFDHAGSFIMSWIIEGAKKAYDHGFQGTVTKGRGRAIEAYREVTTGWGISWQVAVSLIRLLRRSPGNCIRHTGHTACRMESLPEVRRIFTVQSRSQAFLRRRLRQDPLYTA